MDNYQLYRTNIALGGQMKWDIVLENGADETGRSALFVGDLRMSPISNNVPVAKNAKSAIFRSWMGNLLNNTHLFNLKEFYSNISDNFYKPYTNQELDPQAPLLLSDNLCENGNYKGDRSKWIDLHNNTVDRGLSRARWSLYGKQFEFFCPLWLEKFDDDDVLSFDFTIRMDSRKDGYLTNSISKNLTLKHRAHQINHNKFVDYLHKYANDIMLDDKIMFIDFTQNVSAIRGVDVKNGQFIKSLKLPTLAEDLSSSERLMMDFDHIIIKNFQTHNMVARQLFNFNFVFDAEEFFSNNVLKLMWGQNISIDVHAKMNGEELPLKDFYSNYEYINCLPIRNSMVVPKEYHDINIFDLIKDPMNIKLIDKNKIDQSIVHWSVEGNNDYIFNMYSGFGGYILNSDSSFKNAVFNITTKNKDEVEKYDINNLVKQGLAIQSATDYKRSIFDWPAIKRAANLLGSQPNTSKIIVGGTYDAIPISYITNIRCLKVIGIELDPTLLKRPDETPVVLYYTHIVSGDNEEPETHTYTYTLYWENPSVKTVRSTSLYQNSPDIWSKEYSENNSNINWCNSINLVNRGDFKTFLNNLSEYEKHASLVGTKWSGGICFDKEIENPFKALIVVASGSAASTLEDNVRMFVSNSYTKVVPVDPNASGENDLNNIYLVEFDNRIKLLFVSNNSNSKDMGKIVFANLRDNIANYISYAHKVFGEEGFEDKCKYNVRISEGSKHYGLGWLYDLKDWFAGAKEPSSISIKLLGYAPASSPSIYSKELSHYKIADVRSKLIRYSGNIRPCFVSPDLNRIYLKQILSYNDLKKSTYPKYDKYKYKRIYPSLNYFPLESYPLALHPDGREVFISGKPINTIMPYEWKLYGNNEAILLHETMSFDVKNYDDNGLIENFVIEEAIINILKTYYDTFVDARYIYDKYNVTINWEHAVDTNIDKKIYNIKLTLK